MPQVNPATPLPLSYKNIAAAATTVIKAKPGMLKAIIVNACTAATTITMYDNASAASGTKLGTVALATTYVTPGRALYEVNFTLGLTIVTTGTFDITIAYA